VVSHDKSGAKRKQWIMVRENSRSPRGHCHHIMMETLPIGTSPKTSITKIWAQKSTFILALSYNDMVQAVENMVGKPITIVENEKSRSKKNVDSESEAQKSGSHC